MARTVARLLAESLQAHDVDLIYCVPGESYLGLTDSDFKADPYRRYAGSFLDNISTEQHRTYLKYSISPNDDLDLRFAGYYNQFERDWFKIRNIEMASAMTTAASELARVNRPVCRPLAALRVLSCTRAGRVS